MRAVIAPATGGASGYVSGTAARSEQAAPLTCSLRSQFFIWPPAVASRACGSIRCATARLSFAERLTVGSVRSWRTSPGWGL